MLILKVKTLIIYNQLYTMWLSSVIICLTSRVKEHGPC